MAAQQLFQMLTRLRLHLIQRQAAAAAAVSHQVHCLFDRNRIDVREQRVDQFQQLQLQLTALLDLAVKEQLADVVGLTRHDVGQHRDDTLCTQRQQGNNLVIVARVDIQLVAAGLDDLCDVGDVAAGFLGCHDVWMGRKGAVGFGGDIDTGAGWYIVQDDWQVGGIGNRMEVANQSSLGGFIVIRGDVQQRIGSGTLCLLGHPAMTGTLPCTRWTV